MRKPTIYEALKLRLQREPTHEEIKQEVKMILDLALAERKRGKK